MTGMTFIHIDSNGQPYNSDPTFNTFNFINTSQIYSPNAYNINVKLPQALNQIQKVYLKAFETPLLFPNIRENSRLNFFTISCNGTIKTIKLVDKNYTDYATLISDLNIASSATYPADGIIFSLASDTGYSGNFKITSANFATIFVVQSNLSYILGFRPAINLTYNNNVVAPYKANLAFDTYINLFISNLASGNSPNINNILCSFKIPIATASQTVSFSSENINFSQFVNITNKYAPITELKISFFDRLGYSLHSMGSDWTGTLAFEHLA